MVLPSTINLAAAPSSPKTDTVGHELGVGYARLAVQLIACWMRLHRVWLMDDNVQDCYKLDFQHLLQRQKHTALQRVSFGEVMKTVEDQVCLAFWCMEDQVALGCCLPLSASNFLSIRPCESQLTSIFRIIKPHYVQRGQANPVALVTLCKHSY